MTSPETDLMDRSLEEIEDDRWGPPPEGSSGLVADIHRLRQVPIGRLGVEGMRELFLQNEGVDVLLPLALETLRENPLSEGDLYPGDLLSAVLLLRDEAWTRHPRELDMLLALLPTVDRDDPDYPVVTDLDDKIAAFLERHGSGNSS